MRSLDVMLEHMEERRAQQPRRVHVLPAAAAAGARAGRIRHATFIPSGIYSLETPVKRKTNLW